jgi:hypothetical protein
VSGPGRRWRRKLVRKYRQRFVRKLSRQDSLEAALERAFLWRLGERERFEL